MRRLRIVAISLLVTCGMLSVAQNKPASAPEEAGIRRAALDYIEGWYQGDAARMERALHPDLVKRAPMPLPTGKEVLQGASKHLMVEATRAGAGTKSPNAKQKIEVTVFDIQDKIASAKVVSGDFVDYLHLLKTDGEWKIVNVLWVPLQPIQPRG